MNARAEFNHAEHISDIIADVNRGHLRSEPLDITRYRNGPGSMPAIPSTWPKWSEDDRHAAAALGWYLGHSKGQICALPGSVNKSPFQFSCDAAAQAFVGCLASRGYGLACRAFEYLADRCGLIESAELVVAAERNNG